MNPLHISEIDSPNEMLVDSDDLALDAENEKDEGVHEIHPLGEKALRADDKQAIREEVFKIPIPEQPEILEEAEHTWTITEWNNQPRRVRGPIFWAAGHPWRVLMFPKGNNVDFASFYLEHGYGEEAAKEMPENFAVCVQFSLILWNPDAPWVLAHHTACHRFTKEEGDWGFTRFVELRRLWATTWEDTGRYLAEGERANMTAIVRHVKDETGVLWHNFVNYDSKAETGYVGLKNQGATCYLNSLLQSLYFTNAFRKAIYQIPTQNEETLQNSAYTLQRLFYQLQTANNAVSTMELTKSFGWETRHIFEQQDVQELSRKLMERMEEKMKGTEAENVLPKLFSGKVRTYIDCINVDYESRRVEDFWDVQLNVSGNKNVQESFVDYIEVEIMNGENQYMAGDTYKLQDAKKGVIFESFPEVLHLQLKRFQYDIERDAMMKINDRYEFPETFDAAPYLAENADKSEPWIYQLHGVLVHSGDLNAGHYYAFIKPNKDGWFYKFDDDKVTRATMREVLEDNFGGEVKLNDGNTLLRLNTKKPALRQNSAYMLVYIRQSRAESVLLPVTTEDTPPHLQKKLEDEAAEREARRKAKEEQHLYVEIRVVTDETYKAYEGTDLTTFDPNRDTEAGAPKTYKVLRKAPLTSFIESIAQDWQKGGVDPRRVRIWDLVNRQNKTTRPDHAFNEVDDVTVEEAFHKMNGKMSDLRVWAEIAEEVDAETGEPLWPNVTEKNVASPMILLFLKQFDVAAQSLFGIGHIYVNREKRVEELVPIIGKKMGWIKDDASTEQLQLRLYEEIKPQMIETMKGKMTLKAAELQDGDIVCFQIAPEPSDVVSKTQTLMTPPSRSGSIQSDVIMGSDSDSLATLVPSTTNGSANTWVTVDTSDSPSAMKGSIPKSPKIRPGQIGDAVAYYDFLLHRREIQFWPHPSRNPTGKEFESVKVMLSTKHTYENMAKRVGDTLGVDPQKLRFWTIHGSSGNPKAAVKRGNTANVQNILNPPYASFSNNSQRNDSLYFEVLDMTLSELETMKALKVLWLSEGISKEDTYDLLVPKNGNVDDLISALITKAKLEDESKAGDIRVYTVHSNKIYKVLSSDFTVVGITDYVQVVCERKPEDEPGPDDNDAHLIGAYHFQGDPSKTHGIPFVFHLIKDEKFSETKKRLEKRTGFKGKNFEKIKFALMRRGSYSKPLYLTDDMVLTDEYREEDQLGLDHADRSRGLRNGAVDLFLK